MGVVYKAHDPRIRRDVALKTIRLAEQATPEETEALKERLFREAQSAGRLSHPGIVTIYDIDEEDGLAYITMEFVDGRTLETMMRSGEAADLAFVSSVMAQTGAALDYAHAQEIVHRDIKPANIIITPQGQVKITDFGIARIASSQLTQTGTVLGTPSYMSPEQVRGDAVDGRSDQFSLSVIAYELVTGAKPFVADSLTAIIFKIVSEEPIPPRDINAALPEQLTEPILQGLAKEPLQRFGNCEALAEAFAGACGHGTRSSLPAQPAKVEPLAATPPELEETAPAMTAVRENVPEAETPEEDTAQEIPVESQTLPPLPAKEATVVATPEEPVRKSRVGWWLGAVAALLAGVVAVAVLLRPELLQDPVAVARDMLSGAGAGYAVELTEGSDSPVGFAGEEPSPMETQGTVPEETSPDLGQANGGEANEGNADTPAEGSPDTDAADTPAEPTATEPPKAEETVAPPKPAPPARPPAVKVQFGGQPAGVEVVVDGRANWTCNAPCELDLPPGNHTAVASLSGFERGRQSFEVETEPLSLSFKLSAIVGTLMVSSDPQEADIYVDGKKADVRTNAMLKLPPGEHVIRVEKAGGGSSEKSVEILPNELQTLQFSMR
jgi:serine/threonine-protein kinase